MRRCFDTIIDIGNNACILVRIMVVERVNNSCIIWAVFNKCRSNSLQFNRDPAKVVMEKIFQATVCCYLCCPQSPIVIQKDCAPS